MEEQLEHFIDQLQVNSDMTSVDWFIEKYKLNAKNRKDEIATLRQYITLLLYKNNKEITTTAIGEKFNQKHCNILYSVKIARERLEAKNPTLIMVMEKYKYDISIINWNL